ncbi:Binding partner of ACD11 1 [Hibiscus syriacus]|uniref:Binding partner of ACD11 1 n=1 Tax=Hibiscus syriacus TaxID=106335 RepID=A0A6A3B8I6_HIBSY|nr:binding partner of ACD11 1-like [Hibiscus syriacus]KAE8713320.1 Binding partner of ACD11 1 [Hibiscus syriacus]
MEIRSVKVLNVSLAASEQDINEFFVFSGEIVHVEMQRDNERSQVAYVTFKDSQGAETAVLLSGATIIDQSVTIELAPDYKLPASAIPATENQDSENAESAVQKAEDVVSTMLAKGFILGKDAVGKAKAFDEKHQFTSTATAKVASLDQKIGFTEKLNAGTIILNEKAKEMDQKYQVSEKTRSALTVAEQKVSTAGSAIMKNPYVLSGATWAMGAYNRVAKAAEEVGQKTREKVLAEEQVQKTEGENSQVNERGSPMAAEHATVEQLSKPLSEQGQKPEGGNAEISLKAVEPAAVEQPPKP